MFHPESFRRYLKNDQAGEDKNYGDSQGQGFFYQGDLRMDNQVNPKITDKLASSVAIAVFVKLVCPN